LWGLLFTKQEMTRFETSTTTTESYFVPEIYNLKQNIADI